MPLVHAYDARVYDDIVQRFRIIMMSHSPAIIFTYEFVIQITVCDAHRQRRNKQASNVSAEQCIIPAVSCIKKKMQRNINVCILHFVLFSGTMEIASNE